MGCHFLLQVSSLSGDRTHISCIDKWILYHWATWEAPNIFINDGINIILKSTNISTKNSAWHMVNAQLTEAVRTILTMILRPCTLAWPDPKSNLDPSPSFPLVTMKSNLQLLTSQRAFLTSRTQSPCPPSSARAGLGNRHSHLEPQRPRRAVNFRHREQHGMVRRPWKGQERRTLWGTADSQSQRETQGMGTAPPIQGHAHELREGRDTPSHNQYHWWSLILTGGS